MKLLIVIYSLQHGGAERVVANLSALWSARGYEVTVATLASKATDFYVLDKSIRRLSLEVAGESIGVGNALVANLRRILALRRVLRRVGPDIVIGVETTASLLSIFASRGLRCKVIATEHIHPPMLPLGRVWTTVRRYAYPSADHVVALTEKTRAWLEQHCRCKNVKVIPNAVSLPIPVFDPVLEPESIVVPGRRMLLAAGRFTTQKGFDCLISAFSQIATDQPQWDLVILGDGAARSALERQIADAGLERRVFMPGQVGNVAQWYARADLYVMSSRFEGFPMTLLEAMASGCAVVSYDCDTGPRDLIKHGENGLLVEPVGEATSLARALSELMTNDDERVRLASNARDVADAFSPVRTLRMWYDLFAEAGVQDVACRADQWVSK
ncbi:glycosyltransferase family 4 protein [Caballeronia sp. LZ065]|uniref:glycosyltransferase family 4 protein n=1 Tax=Caballeronia sp. LZ065 TaxID=3038571 RepID=UPI00285D21D0|nr:glycosyltransferase family 4 protein [Caballeronia sp. LZ065]MDR5781704.1 glycosyltransferase family 4 protein [Caballeronia sp. LZ065]